MNSGSEFHISDPEKPSRLFFLASGSRGENTVTTPAEDEAGVWNARVLLRDLSERSYTGGYPILKFDPSALLRNALPLDNLQSCFES